MWFCANFFFSSKKTNCNETEKIQMMASLTICKDLVSKKKVFLTAGDVTDVELHTSQMLLLFQLKNLTLKTTTKKKKK